MNDTPMLLLSLQSRLKTRSMGMKLIVVCGLAAGDDHPGALC